MSSSGYISGIKSFYDSFSHFYFFVSLIDHRPKNRGVLFSRAKKGDRILCIGFGLGEEIKSFKKQGCETFGIELSQGMIKRARKKNSIENIAKGDTFRLPFKDRSFDIIYSCFLIDIFGDEDIAKLLNEMRRTAKKGGKIISVNNTFEQGMISKVLVAYYQFVKDHLYTRMKTRPIMAEKFFRKAGLKEIKQRKVSWGAEAVSGRS